MSGPRRNSILNGSHDCGDTGGIGAKAGTALECRPKESAYVPLLDPGVDAADACGGRMRRLMG